VCSVIAICSFWRANKLYYENAALQQSGGAPGSNVGPGEKGKEAELEDYGTARSAAPLNK